MKKKERLLVTKKWWSDNKIVCRLCGRKTDKYRMVCDEIGSNVEYYCKPCFDEKIPSDVFFQCKDCGSFYNYDEEHECEE